MKRAIAPGKVVLFGEYAVLRGARALVAAVSRYASAEEVEGPPGLCAPELGLSWQPGEEVPAGLRAAALLLERLGGVNARYELRASAFSAGEAKLGLGASAATLAALAYVRAPALAPEARFWAAHLAHREAQGGIGSGVDIAAATLGGLLSYRQEEAPARCPDGRCGIALLLAQSGIEAHTPTLVRQVMGAPSSATEEALAALSAASEAAHGAISCGEGAGLLGAVRAAAEAIQRLGAASGAPLWREAHARAAEIAAAHGGAAKSTGAAGGDLIAVFVPADQAAALTAALTAAGLPAASLGLDPLGARAAAPLPSMPFLL